MAISTPTTPGQILTSAYLNNNINSGMVYIKSQTIGNTVPNVSVTSAFSATYDSYKIIINGGTSSAGGNLSLGLNGATLGHYSSMIYGGYGGGAVNNLATSNDSKWNYAGSMSGPYNIFAIELDNPFLPYQTAIRGNYADSGNGGAISGYQSQQLSFTGFTITPSTGTLTGGTITVYGFRKA